MSEQAGKFCENIPGPEARMLCRTLAMAIAVSRESAEFASGEVAEGLASDPTQDPFGLGRMRAQMGASFLAAMFQSSDFETDAGEAVPPEQRCSTCPLNNPTNIQEA